MSIYLTTDAKSLHTSKLQKGSSLYKSNELFWKGRTPRALQDQRARVGVTILCKHQINKLILFEKGSKMSKSKSKQPRTWVVPGSDGSITSFGFGVLTVIL